MQVGPLVAGTTYNLSRNLDGSGANDWPSGAVYAVLGYAGSGRVEIDATTSPRLSIITQGTSYNAQTEVVRLGNLNGWGDVTHDYYGAAFGDYAGGNYLRYNPTDGLVFSTASGNIKFLPTGMVITPGSIGVNDITWDDGAGSRQVLEGATAHGTNHILTLTSVAGAGTAEIFAYATNPDAKSAQIDLTPAGGFVVTGVNGGSGGVSANGGLNLGTATGATAGQGKFSGDVFASGKAKGVQAQLSDVTYKQASGALSLTTSWQDIPGLYYTFTPIVAETVIVWFVARYGLAAGTADAQVSDVLNAAIDLYYSAADHLQTPYASYTVSGPTVGTAMAAGNVASSVCLVLSLSAGTAYTLKAQAQNTSGARGTTVAATHMVVWRIAA